MKGSQESHRSEEGVEASGFPILLEPETSGKDRRDGRMTGVLVG